MSRRPALFTQADLARVFAAAKRMGMAVRVDLVNGTADIVSAEDLPPFFMPSKPKPQKIPVL